MFISVLQFSKIYYYPEYDTYQEDDRAWIKAIFLQWMWNILFQLYLQNQVR